MGQEFSRYLNRLPFVLGYGACAQFVLFGFRKNRVLYSARRSLIYSSGYESAVDRTGYLARFRLSSEPIVKYPG
jgi:hypothetical protein